MPIKDLMTKDVEVVRPDDSIKVRQVMTGEVAWCFEDDEIARVIRLMKEKQIRRIPVVNAAKRLVGVVALGDLAQQQESQSAEVLGSVSQAPPNN